jgi:hypothetical protein
MCCLPTLIFYAPIAGASFVRRQKLLAHKGHAETTRYHKITIWNNVFPIARD